MGPPQLPETKGITMQEKLPYSKTKKEVIFCVWPVPTHTKLHKIRLKLYIPLVMAGGGSDKAFESGATFL